MQQRSVFNSRVWWQRSVIPATQRQRQDNRGLRSALAKVSETGWGHGSKDRVLALSLISSTGRRRKRRRGRRRKRKKRRRRRKRKKQQQQPGTGSSCLES